MDERVPQKMIMFCELKENGFAVLH